MNSKPPLALVGLDASLGRAIENVGLTTTLRSFYDVSLPLKDGSLYRFRGKMAMSHCGEHLRPPWETLYLWWATENFVAAREWKPKKGPMVPGIFKAATVITVRDAMELWGWTPVAHEMAARLRIDVSAR